MNDTISQSPIEIRLPEPPMTKFERERRAFFNLLPELLKTHRDQFVAIHDEQVIESGPVRCDVVFRALERARNNIYVGRVTVEPDPVCRSGIRRDLGESRGHS